MPIGAARYLAIRCFTASTRRPADTSGLSLLLATWLDIARPTVAIRKDGFYKIGCKADRGAELVVDWFGGVISKDGKTVTGYVQDLTG